jgi:hypothetical protein
VEIFIFLEGVESGRRAPKKRVLSFYGEGAFQTTNMGNISLGSENYSGTKIFRSDPFEFESRYPHQIEAVEFKLYGFFCI